MDDDKSKSIDLLGIKPISETIHTVTKATIDAASAFLSRICLPAAEELGLMLRDKVSNWRAKNAVAIVEKAEKKFRANQFGVEYHAHPRMVVAAIEHGSWTDDATVQEMWGGLLASSCTMDGKDDSNLIFINLLSQINRTEAILFRHACETAKKMRSPAGWIYAEMFVMELSSLQTLIAISDEHRIDRELDHLRSLELIDGGFQTQSQSTAARLAPTALGLNLYVRCQGYTGSPVEYFKLDKPEMKST